MTSEALKALAERVEAAALLREAFRLAQPLAQLSEFEVTE